MEGCRGTASDDVATGRGVNAAQVIVIATPLGAVPIYRGRLGDPPSLLAAYRLLSGS